MKSGSVPFLTFCLPNKQPTSSASRHPALAFLIPSAAAAGAAFAGALLLLLLLDRLLGGVQLLALRGQELLVGGVLSPERLAVFERLFQPLRRLGRSIDLALRRALLQRLHQLVELRRGFHDLFAVLADLGVHRALLDQRTLLLRQLRRARQVLLVRRVLLGERLALRGQRQDLSDRLLRRIRVLCLLQRALGRLHLRLVLGVDRLARLPPELPGELLPLLARAGDQLLQLLVLLRRPSVGIERGVQVVDRAIDGLLLARLHACARRLQVSLDPLHLDPVAQPRRVLLPRGEL